MMAANVLAAIALWACVFLVRVHAQTQEQSEAATPSLIFHIEHSFDHGATFKPRTTAQIVTKPDGRMGLMFEDKNSISGEDIAALKNLLQTNEMYSIRMKSSAQSKYVVASIPACELQKSGFKEEVSIFMTGSTINGLAYSSPQMTIPQPCDPAAVRDAVALQTRIKMGDDVVVPPLPLQLQGLRPGYMANVRLGLEEEKQQAQQQGSQSFLSKYWYVVLGLVIYMLLGGSGEAPQGQPAQGQQAAARPKQQ